MKKMVINRRNTERWKSDVNQSVLFYNEWFLNFAPATYVKARKDAIAKVEIAFSKTDAFRRLTANVLEDAACSTDMTWKALMRRYLKKP